MRPRNFITQLTLIPLQPSFVLFRYSTAISAHFSYNTCVTRWSLFLRLINWDLWRAIYFYFSTKERRWETMTNFRLQAKTKRTKEKKHTFIKTERFQNFQFLFFFLLYCLALLAVVFVLYCKERHWFGTCICICMLICNCIYCFRM